MSDKPIDLSGDASSFEEMSQAKLQTLAELARETRELEAAIESMTKELEERQARLRDLVELKMPEILMEMNISEIKLTTGEKLVMKKFYAGHISEEHKEAAFKWLRENNFDSLIKNEVKGTFGKGEDEKVQMVMDLLSQKFPGIFSAKSSVHPQTLKSFIKEQLEAGENIPQDLFGVHVGNKVTIK